MSGAEPDVIGGGAEEWVDDVDVEEIELFAGDAVREGARPVGRVELTPGPAAVGTRLDKYLAEAVPDLSRAYLQQLIDAGRVLVDGQPRRRSHRISAGEAVTLDVPPPVVEAVVPEEIPLEIVFEDEDVIVLNKPAGLVVHPAPGHARGTLVNALLAHAPEMAVSGSHRPGIVHRLDKDTSGLMVVAKTDRARTALVAQWNERTVEKAYVALVRGRVEEEEATIDAPIGRDPNQRQRMAVVAKGRQAVSHFSVRERFDEATLLDVLLETGRTHQIRVHLAFIGHPIVGDPVYNRVVGPLGGTRSIVRRQFLHAARLAFRLPGGAQVRFEAALPADLERALTRLRGGAPPPPRDQPAAEEVDER